MAQSRDKKSGARLKQARLLSFLLLVLALLLPVSAKAAPMDLPAKSAVLMDVATGKLLYEQDHLSIQDPERH